MISVGCIVKVKKYPEWGVFRVISIHPNTFYWTLDGIGDRVFSDDDLILVRNND